MALPLELVRGTFSQELEAARRVAARAGFELDADVDGLTIKATFHAPAGRDFILHGRFDDYPSQPPFLEFEDPATGERGTAGSLPRSADSFFHSGCSICAPFNRNAYVKVHTNWQLAAWKTSTEQNVCWNQYSTMPKMLWLIASRIHDSNFN